MVNLDRAAALLALLLPWASACGSDDVPTEPGPDTTAPTLISSVPRSMTEDAPAGSPLVLVFSEPMDPARGTVTVSPGGDLEAADGSWDANQVLTVRPTLEAGSTYRVTLSGFRDAAGNPLGEQSFLFSTAAVPDDTAPRLLSTMPIDGATDVPATLTTLRWSFSEPMDQSVGSVQSVGAAMATVGELSWVGPDVLSVTISGLAEGQSYGFRPEGFTDLAGNPVEGLAAVLGDDVLDFTVAVVADTTAPTVVGTMPVDNAPAVSPNLATISLSFSEPMDSTRTGATLSGGPAPVTLNGTWSGDQQMITFAVSLSDGVTYALRLDGFRDLAGNALNDTAFLGNGALDFTTEVIPDMDPPEVVATAPSEGSTGVPLALSEIRVTFDEAMNPSQDRVVLEDTTRSTTATLAAVWTDGNTVLTAGVSGLVLGRDYRLDLRQLRDAANNLLDGTPVLGDGYLDFSTPPDLIPPTVVSASPTEGASDITPRLEQVVIVFSERVNPATLAVNLADGTTSTGLTPTLDATGTEVTYAVGGSIEAGFSYQIDLTGVEDLAGNALGAVPVLGDGILDFTAPPRPTGFTCANPLTEPYGNPTANGVLFSIPAGASGRNGSLLCDANGSGDDIVIEYRKVSGTVASGGSLLRVSATTAGTEGLNVEVLGGACTLGPSASREKCFWNKEDVDVILDVPAGTYYIWVSNTNSDTSQTFEGATVTVEEIPTQFAEGEGCWLPYDTTSSNYTPPVSPGDPARWAIAPTAINSFDMDVTWGREGSISCDDTPGFGDIHGVDAVVEYTPSVAGSVIQVIAESQNPIGPDINVEILDRCESTNPGKRSLGCSADARRHELVTTSTAPIYIWVSTEGTSDPWPGVNLSVSEITPQVGESCATGRPIPSAGQVTLANQSTQSIGAPACLTTGGNPVEWYRYTVSGGRVRITSSSPTALAVGDATATRADAVQCRDDVSAFGFGTAVPPGTTLCIAVPSGFGASDFTISDETDNYVGVGSSTTAVAVAPANAWNDDVWMASSPNWVYFARSGGDVQRFAKSIVTSTQASTSTAVEVFSSSTNVGRAGLVVSNERVFSLSPSTSVSTSRLFRIWDGAASMFSASAWDLTPVYAGGDDTRAITYDGSSFLYASHRTGGVDIYSVSAASAQSPALLGTNATVQNVVGLAADGSFLYLVGESVGTGQGGVFRLDRASLGTTSALATNLLPLRIDTSSQHPAYLNDPLSPRYLYVKADEPSAVFVIEAPDSFAPILRGPRVELGRPGDDAWTFDPTSNAILFYETETTASGRIILMR